MNRPRKIPRMAAALVPREQVSWGLTAITLGAVEGGLLGVIVKNQFADVASPLMVNIAAAVVASAPSFTNLSSFVFASLANGRDKRRLLIQLMLFMGACLFVLALPSISAGGLVLFCIATVLARTAWTGILTLRAAVWRVNYSREWRGRVTGRIVQVSSVLVGAYAALVGYLLDWRDAAFRPAFILAAVCSLVAAHVYRKAHIRRHGQLLAAERAEQAAQGTRAGLASMLDVLRQDADFRHYMVAMMVLGSGNIMLLPILIVQMNDQLDMGLLEQVMITSSLPLLVLGFMIPFWARLLDRRHIFGYRAIHSWFFVATSVLFTVAAITHRTEWLWPASVMLGISYAGGNLGWNLGHNDFSNDGTSSQYMAIHVTLTGLRGLVVPLIGIGFYQLLAAHSATTADYALLFPLLLNLAGSVYFVSLHREQRHRHAGSA